jgi:prepilin-type N-terminal cleavage/methylation domain-containing protein
LSGPFDTPVVLGRNDRGFTLIELMIVVVVLGILAGLVLLGVQPFSSTSIAAACRSEIDSLKTANVAYRAGHGSDAPDATALISGGYLDAAPKYVTISAGTTNPATDAGCDAISGSAAGGSSSTTSSSTSSTSSSTTSSTSSTTSSTTSTTVATTARVSVVAGIAAPGSNANSPWRTTITVTVTTNLGVPIQGADVSGTWSYSGTLSPRGCNNTNALGVCSFSTNHNASEASAAWTVTSVSAPYPTGSHLLTTATCLKATVVTLTCVPS